jgi:hypothetical protein
MVCILNVHIWPKIVGEIFGQFEQNLAKSGLSLEKVSQSRGFTFSLKQI